jgi:hypothetical protein
MAADVDGKNPRSIVNEPLHVLQRAAGTRWVLRPFNSANGSLEMSKWWCISVLKRLATHSHAVLPLHKKVLAFFE